MRLADTRASYWNGAGDWWFDQSLVCAHEVSVIRSLSDRPTCNSINKVQLIFVGHDTKHFYTLQALIYIESMYIFNKSNCLQVIFPFAKVYNGLILDKIIWYVYVENDNAKATIVSMTEIISLIHF